jgi:hypothetical protein
MGTINVLVAVNGAQLAQQVADGSIKPGSQASPTGLGSYQQSDVYIAMIAQSSVVVNDGGQSELTIKANSGDTIRWTMQSFDGNADYTAYIYNSSFNPPNITPLTYFNMTTSSYLPPGSVPTAAPVLVHNQSYVAQGTITTPGATIQYTLSFVLVDNSSGKIIGYFYWDPFINVSK